ncbi:MAG: hypothetical protein HYV90_03965 [Candidatus Woesebacteria bacterium]|nr:MAG: hypothetical protein HYV90_03965 [Candidatus Woesebacteria bacterium]
MKNKAAIAVVVILLLGIAGYFYFSKSKNVETASGISSGVKSLKELLASGVPQKCTFASDDESGKTEGTSYIAGGKVRADFTSTLNGKTTVSHMISDNKTSYIWTDDDKNGFKMTVPDSDTKATTAPVTGEAAQASEVDLNQKSDYKCSAWIPDNSMFTPPADVKFTDFSEMFKPSPAANGSGSSQQCSICDSLTGDDKTSCLSALNCN